MFLDISLSLTARLVDVCKLLSIAKNGGESISDEASLIKGLAFVQIYAAYEYALKESVRATLNHITNNTSETESLCPHLSALLWNSKWVSVQSSSRKNIWKSRLELVECLKSLNDVNGIDETVFPNDGSHFRVEQIFTICSLFGLNYSLPDVGLTFRISELVENRNKIAHGELRPETVGCRYTFDEIEKVVEDIEKLCNHLLDELKLHCSSRRMIAS